MNQTRTIAILGLALFGLSVSLRGAPVTVASPRSLAPLVQKWLQSFQTNNPEVKVRFRTTGGESGITTLQNRQADLVVVGTKIKRAEELEFISAFGKRPREYAAAINPLLIFVNEGNPVTELDLDTLNGIFSGRITNWKEIGGADVSITLYTREYDSSSFEFFKGAILKDSPPILSAQVIPGQSGMLRAVARDRAGIGYGGPTLEPGVRALKIKKGPRTTAIEPTRETFRDGTYPLTRYVYAYVHPARDSGAVAQCLAWIRSEEGQDIARENGFYRLPPNFREK
jgi:phosphate transport system substrate-binding protein